MGIVFIIFAHLLILSTIGAATKKDLNLRYFLWAILSLMMGVLTLVYSVLWISAGQIPEGFSLAGNLAYGVGSVSFAVMSALMAKNRMR